jgi:uncharacterized membrane protein
MLTSFFAVLTSFTNALAITFQHIASTSDEQHRRGWRFVLYLVRHPLWLLGWLALVGSLVFQALALHFGPMSLVQPILVTELVLALVLRRLWLRQSIRAVTWVGAAVTSVALAAFLSVTSPHGGTRIPTTSSWILPIIVCLGGAGVLVGLAQHGSPSRRAGLFAAATAIIWALEATFIKGATNTLVRSGVGGTVDRWPLYAFIATGILGLLAEQAALHVGPLKVSQPIIVIVDPFVSIVLGLWLYHEHVHGGVSHVGIGALSFAVMCVGVVVLTRTAPDTMTSDIHRI